MTLALTINTKRPLWFEPFLQQLKAELGYPFDISKYQQLLSWSNANPWNNCEQLMYSLYTVCRVLFLQNDKHEARFKELFWNYVVDELAFEQALIQQMKPIESNGSETPVVDPIGTGTGGSNVVAPNLKGDESIVEPLDQIEAEEKITQSKKKYLNLTIPPAEKQEDTVSTSLTSSRFLLSDIYLPLTKREMLHGWRHLRKRENYRPGNRLDINATVQQSAKEGILVQPVFEKVQVNCDDLLLILADRRGSMIPFHKLTDNIIESAIKGGGHRNALVYYFYNCPLGVVYKKPNLTEPVPLTELYSRIRPDHTNALVISDAGAARGNMNELRVKMVREFLYGKNEKGDSVTKGLHKSALFVAWLNPMPMHRWVDTTAASIASDPDTPMFSIMENGYGSFLQLVDKLMGK